MSDYNQFSFEVEENDVLRVLRTGAACGVSAMLYVNGMYYSVKFEENVLSAIREELNREDF